ncbi:MAG: hypothetical protein WAM42_22990 [Candidatus Nitrosopolaris sp.]
MKRSCVYSAPTEYFLDYVHLRTEGGASATATVQMLRQNEYDCMHFFLLQSEARGLNEQ